MRWYKYLFVHEEKWAKQFALNPPWSYCSGVSTSHNERNHGPPPTNADPTSAKNPEDYPEEQARLAEIE